MPPRRPTPADSTDGWGGESGPRYRTHDHFASDCAEHVLTCGHDGAERIPNPGARTPPERPGPDSPARHHGTPAGPVQSCHGALAETPSRRVSA